MDLLVLRPGALGDTLMLAPAAGCISSTHRVTVVGREPGISFLGRTVARVYDMERGGWHRLFSERPSEGGVPVEGADAVVGFLSDHQGVVGENLRRFFPSSSVHLFPAFPGAGRSIHASGYVAECFEAAGLPVNASEAVSSACSEAVLGTAGFTERKPWVVFHPGSGDRRKNHSIDMWRDLASRLRAGLPARAERFIWLLGPAEMECRTAFEALCRSTGGEVMWCPGPQKLLSLFERCCLYLGQDSGITHAAAMSGAPCVALFRTSDPVQWRPLGPAVEVVAGPDGEAIVGGAVRAALKVAALRDR